MPLIMATKVVFLLLCTCANALTSGVSILSFMGNIHTVLLLCTTTITPLASKSTVTHITANMILVLGSVYACAILSQAVMQPRKTVLSHHTLLCSCWDSVWYRNEAVDRVFELDMWYATEFWILKHKIKHRLLYTSLILITITITVTNKNSKNKISLHQLIHVHVHVCRHNVHELCTQK